MNTTTEKMLQELASRDSSLPTPCYIVNEDILRENIFSLKRAFEKRFRKFIFGYSYKTNYAPEILRTIHRLGGYAEVVSPMELALAKKLVRYDHIIYNGVIQDADGKLSVLDGGGMVNVENMTELLNLNEEGARCGKVYRVGIRLNLPMSGSSSTPSRFGIELTGENFRRLKALARQHIQIAGIHCHVTKSRSMSSWKERAFLMGAAAKTLGSVEYIDFGGNMYGPMNPELVAQFKDSIPTFQDYADCIHEELARYYTDEAIPTVIVEPGTPIVSNAQSYLTAVKDIKTVAGKTFCTLDGKRLDITVLGDSGKQFPFYVIGKGDGYVIGQGIGMVRDAALCGCTCLEQDRLADGYTGQLRVGDYILFDNVGSYSNTVAPRFIQGVPTMMMYRGPKEGFFTVKLADSYDDVLNPYF